MNKKSTQNLLILILSLVTVACLCVTGWAVFLRPAQSTDAAAQQQDYAPVELEPNAQPIAQEPEPSASSQAVEEGGGHVTLSYTLAVTVQRSTRTVSLFYQNPSTSYNPVSLQVVLVDKNGTEAVIAQSGLLEPGTQVTSLALDSSVNLPAGSYDGYYSLGFYDPATGEKSVVNSVVQGLSITVQ